MTADGSDKFVLRTDERTEAVRALRMVANLLPQVEGDSYMWKWVVIALQNAVQAFMVLALQGTWHVRVLLPNHAKKMMEAWENGDHERMFKDYYLDDFLQLYRKVQDECMMGQYVHSKAFAAEGTVTTSMERLVRLRNDFIHFVPMTLYVDVSDLPNVVLDVLNLINFLAFESQNVFWGLDEHQAVQVQDLLEQVGRSASQLAAIYPTPQP